jgi:hypothetical protein
MIWLLQILQKTEYASKLSVLSDCGHIKMNLFLPKDWYYALYNCRVFPLLLLQAQQLYSTESLHLLVHSMTVLLCSGEQQERHAIQYFTQTRWSTVVSQVVQPTLNNYQIQRNKVPYFIYFESLETYLIEQTIKTVTQSLNVQSRTEVH